MKFKELLFGTAGIPLSTQPRDTINGIKRVKELGLGSMEIEFVRTVNLNEQIAPKVKKTAEENNIVLSCHGQYFVNLNAKDKSILEASKKRILDACRRANQAGVFSICYHIAYYLDLPKEKAYENIKKNLKEIIKTLKDEGNPILIRPETGGKISQFGDVDELIKISQEIDQVLPCIDWAHHFSRSLGKLNSYEQFKEIAIKLEKGLGRTVLDNMHCHMEGIEYGNTGERNHVNLKDCSIDYKAVAKVWKDFNIKGVITCESPNIEGDALLLKRTYDAL